MYSSLSETLSCMGADHLGSPRHVTDGGRYAPDGTMMTHGTGQIVGEQAFGPYGEQMIGEFNGKRFPSGYTGHINEDATGLIYMRGRYYSPLWHRFVNSDQGADPNSLNQYAYVGGRPFSATDPSGMEMWCWFRTTTVYYMIDGQWCASYTYRENTGDCWEVGGGGGNPQSDKNSHIPEFCQRLADLGITSEDFLRMRANMQAQLANQSQSPAPGVYYREFGYTYAETFGKNGGLLGQYYENTPSNNFAEHLYSGYGTNSAGSLLNVATVFTYPLNYVSGHTFHTHPIFPNGWEGYNFQKGWINGTRGTPSDADFNSANTLNNMNHFVGSSEGIYQYLAYDGVNVSAFLAGPSWENEECEKYLPAGAVNRRHR